MAGPFQVENPGVGITYTLDALGNTTQSGTVAAASLAAASYNFTGTGTQGAASITGIQTFQAGAADNTGAAATVLLGGTIGSGNAAILGTAASGTQLADVTRDYMVYIGVT